MALENKKDFFSWRRVAASSEWHRTVRLPSPCAPDVASAGSTARKSSSILRTIGICVKPKRSMAPISFLLLFLGKAGVLQAFIERISMAIIETRGT